MTTRTTPTLTEVAAEFAEWRRTRPTQRTPEALQQKTIMLLSNHRIGEVLKALNLSHKNVKRWKQRWSTNLSTATPAKSTVFKVLPALSEPIDEDTAALCRTRLKLTRRHSADSGWSIEGELSARQWRWAMRLLDEGGSR